MARGLRKALDEHSRRDESTKRESVIFGELGTMATGGENVPEIREKLAPPGKYPSKSAPRRNRVQGLRSAGQFPGISLTTYDWQTLASPEAKRS